MKAAGEKDGSNGWKVMRNKTTAIMLVILLAMLSGCATWNGIKYDTKKAWKSGKRVVHDATA